MAKKLKIVDPTVYQQPMEEDYERPVEVLERLQEQGQQYLERLQQAVAVPSNYASASTGNIGYVTSTAQSPFDTYTVRAKDIYNQRNYGYTPYQPTTMLDENGSTLFYAGNKWFMKVTITGKIEFNTREFPDLTSTKEAEAFLDSLQAITHIEKGQFTFAWD